jgi:DNA-binding GntR family transcriptional regulator
MFSYNEFYNFQKEWCRKYAIETITEENLLHLEEILEQMAQATENRDSPEYHEANKRFHLIKAFEVHDRQVQKQLIGQ